MDSLQLTQSGRRIFRLNERTESKADYNSVLGTGKCKQQTCTAVSTRGYMQMQPYLALSQGDTSSSSKLFVAMMSEIKLAFSITARLSNLPV